MSEITAAERRSRLQNSENIFINCSNHPSAAWGDEQRRKAEVYGKIIDLPFPEVDPAWTAGRIREEAERVYREIVSLHPAAVMCQGEFTFTYALVSRLKENGLTVLAACSRRRVEEISDETGNTQKKVIFTFEGFREY